MLILVYLKLIQQQLLLNDLKLFEKKIYFAPEYNQKKTIIQQKPNHTEHPGRCLGFLIRGP